MSPYKDVLCRIGRASWLSKAVARRGDLIDFEQLWEIMANYRWAIICSPGVRNSTTGTRRYTEQDNFPYEKEFIMTKEFKTVSSFRDLAQFGITGLTGEACAYGMRTLCDVNEDGAALLADFFGISSLTLNKNWNQVVNGKPATGSIMLTHDIVPKLAQFAFFREGALAVILTSGGREVNGLFEQERVQQYRDLITKMGHNCLHSMVTNHTISSGVPMSGSRNVHQATGRAH
jgi:hypothetical protein